MKNFIVKGLIRLAETHCYYALSTILSSHVQIVLDNCSWLSYFFQTSSLSSEMVGIPTANDFIKRKSEKNADNLSDDDNIVLDTG